jgi:uncharacterized protein (DUF885 family)
MKWICLFLLLLGSVSSAMNQTKPKAEDIKMRKFLQKEWDWSMKEFPESATAVGYPGQDDRWTDVSRAAIDARKKHTKDALKALRTIKKGSLSKAERLNYDLYEAELLLDIEGQQFPGEYLAISPMGGIQSAIAETLDSMSISKPQDFENILARLEKAPAIIEQNIQLLREGAAAGVTPPKITLKDVDNQIAAQLEADPEKNPMLGPFRKIPSDFPADKAKVYRERAAQVLKEKVIPAYKNFRKFFRDEYYPKTRATIGFSELPNGKAWYAFSAKRHTTTSLTPQQIHDIGLSEVKRIRAEMEVVKREAGFKGTLGEFFEYLRTDDQFFYEKPGDLLMAYRDISKRADEALPRLFGKLPRLPYGVQPIPEYAERASTTAYYRPGSPKAGRAGVFFANTYNLKARPKREMEGLSLHEAVPGHHLQIALAQEEEGLPDFRQNAGYTAYVEGWGLYSESLGDVMGFYKDPYTKTGKLIYEMWRAVRLVVDTGMHAFGWSREKALEFFEENTGKAHHDVAVEVDRYIVWPGQALAYKIGQLKILEIRERAKSKLKDKFDIREFHDAVLGDGALPLDVFERRMDEWMASKASMKTTR